MTTGFGYAAPMRHRQSDVVTGLITQIRDVRRMGAAVIDFCWLARGRVDAYYERGLNAWDYAAGALIAHESGAVVTGLHDDDFSAFVLAGAPAIAAGPARRARGARCRPALSLGVSPGGAAPRRTSARCATYVATASAKAPSATTSAVTTAGTPRARAWGGTTLPLPTTAPAPTSAHGPTTARCRTTEPDPTSESSWMVQPSRCAL